MALRDRVTLATPITRTTLKGWYLEQRLEVDLATRRVTGFIRFYDTAGNLVRSKDIDARITRNRRDQLAADVIADVIAQDATLNGSVTVEDVGDVDDPIANP